MLSVVKFVDRRVGAFQWAERFGSWLLFSASCVQLYSSVVPERLRSEIKWWIWLVLCGKSHAFWRTSQTPATSAREYECFISWDRTPKDWLNWAYCGIWCLWGQRLFQVEMSAEAVFFVHWQSPRWRIVFWRRLRQCELKQCGAALAAKMLPYVSVSRAPGTALRCSMLENLQINLPPPAPDSSRTYRLATCCVKRA